jgi:hypothetical protein
MGVNRSRVRDVAVPHRTGDITARSPGTVAAADGCFEKTTSACGISRIPAIDAS